KSSDIHAVVTNVVFPATDIYEHTAILRSIEFFTRYLETLIRIYVKTKISEAGSHIVHVRLIRYEGLITPHGENESLSGRNHDRQRITSIAEPELRPITVAP